MRLNLLKYYDEKWRVVLSPKFKEKLIIRLKNMYTREAISKKLGISFLTVGGFYRGRYNADLKFASQLTELAKISHKELLENIDNVYTCTIGGHFNFMKELDINPVFAQWFSVWIGDGDHKQKKGRVSLTNYSVDVLKLHLYVLRKIFAFQNNKIRAEVTTNQKSKEITRKSWSKKLGLPLSQIIVSFNKNAIKETVRVRVGCTILFRILEEAKEEIKNIIEKSPDKTKINYLRGLFAAEGSCRKRGFQIRLCMKDIVEIRFAKKLLDDLNIYSKIRCDSWRIYYQLSIFGWENIMNFKKTVGFGEHKARNKKLDEMIKMYKKVPITERYRDIISIAEKQKRITTNDLVMKGYEPKYARYLLRNLAKKNLLKVDKSNKIFVYSLNNKKY